MAGKYQAYPEYKYSGLDYYGEIPSDWHLEKIKYNSYVKGRQGWQNLRSDEYQNKGPYLVTGAHFNNEGGVDWNQCHHISNERYDRDRDIWIKKNDVLITKDGTIGKVAFIEYLPYKACLNSHLLIIRDLYSKYDQRFLFYLLSSSCFKGFIPTRQTGTTFMGITQEAVEEFPLVLCPVEEQQKIANFLDHETAKIDTLIDKQQQLIKLLKEKRQAVISHAVTKGLNPNAPMRDSGVEWLGEVPAHWDVVPIKYIVSIPVTDGPHETPEFIDEGVPFISAEAVSTGKINFEKIRAHISEEDNKRYSLKYSPKKYDIYMVKSGATTGVTAIVETDDKFNIWSPLAVIRCKEDSYPYFVLNFMRSLNFQEAVELNWSFGTQQNIGMGVIENLHVTRPPLEEAKLIVEMLAEKCGAFDLIIEKALYQIELMQERRTALISAAVTGKIDVRDWQAPLVVHHD